MVAAAGALAFGMSACSSPRPSATTSTTAPPTSSSTSSTSTTAGLGHCQAKDLAGSVLGSEGAAGTQERTFGLRNTSGAPCALEGYPGAQLYDKNGTALPTTVVRGGPYSFTSMAPTAVTIAPGASAYFNVGYSDVPTASDTGQCPTAASLWVTPPDDVDHLVVSVSIQACGGGKLNVSPVFAAGSPGSQTTAAGPP
jgi:hypothetical protein